jgi:serine/threonine protein phosphatase PrpC
MIICPQCKAENTPGSSFCKKCGAVFDNQLEPPTIPLDGADQTQPHPVDTGNGLVNFMERPEGAIFGNRFLYDSLRFKNANEIRYTVIEQSPVQRPRFRICSNPDCGTVHPPAGEEIEQLCTQCGAPLQDSTPLFLLQEARKPIFGVAVDVANKPGGLAHPNVRAPLAYFSETVAGETRYSMVTPYYSPFPERIESTQVLRWGIQLARGLDYLHQNQLSFGGQIDESCFGLDGTHPVWVNFTGCNVPPEMVIQARPGDARALAGVVYQWLTGKNQFSFEAGLPAAINHLFQEALTGTGYTTGEALARAIETAESESLAKQSVDYRLGRYTDVGQERTLNEDSLVTVELSLSLQSISQPLGVFAVADGMGGHSAGEIASGTIVNTIARRALTLDPLQPTSPEERKIWLKDSVEAANKAVFDLRKSAGTDMGSTLVVALLDGVQATLAHAGDSRIYLVNEQKIQQLTTDHSLVERLIATGQITREEARNHPQRNVVYRTIGDKLNMEVEISSHTLAPGDSLLLCSDGLSGMVEDRYLQKIILDAACPQDACERLIAAANAAGGEDNITAIVIELAAV